MKKIRLFSLGLGLIFILAFLWGCGGSSGEKKGATVPEKKKEQITLKLGMSSPADENHSWLKYSRLMAEKVQQKTNGNVKIQVYPAAQLGADREMLEALQLGSLEMGLISTMVMGSFVPKIQVFDLPYIFPPDNNKVDKILDGSIGKQMASEAEKSGFKILAYWENDWRHISNSKVRVEKLGDLKGLKLRIPETPILMDWFKRINVLVTPMAFSEVYTALQQKTIDGQDNGVNITFASRFQEVQKYYTLSYHIYSPVAMMVSKKVWDGLPQDVQKALEETAQELAVEQRAYNRKAVDTYLAKMKEAGVEIIKLSPESMKEFQDSARPTIEKFSETLGKDIINQMMQYR